MKRSSEAGPRCQCGAIAEIVGPGRAKCNAEVRQIGGFGKYCGREFAFSTETRTFYVVDDDVLTKTGERPLDGGGSVA